MTVRAIYENGVFRPTKPVQLPERSEVEFDPKVVNGNQDDSAAQERIYALLGQSFASGERDVAERHDEHQP
jgi:predicted DNA-binding antitoxin AbrB/MazE fold protein